VRPTPVAGTGRSPSAQTFTAVPGTRSSPSAHVFTAVPGTGVTAESEAASVFALGRRRPVGHVGRAGGGERSYDLPVRVALYVVIVVAFLVVAVVVVRRKQSGAIVERLPLAEGEHVLLEEEGLKLFHRFRQTAVRGGGTVTHRVRSVLTDRRVVLATGGPEGKHKFVILMILDYTTAAPSVPESGYAAYLRKFGLENGYPTYACSAKDVSVEEHDGETRLRVVVPFPEGGDSWGAPPEVRLSTPQAARYAAAISGTSGS
jgi:hypothetical protein